MIVLDTNVLSALMRATPEPTVVAWLNQQAILTIWTTAISVYEIEFGLRSLPKSVFRNKLRTAFNALISEDMEERILPFDTLAALEAAELAAATRVSGRTREIRDLQIAGTVRANSAMLATGNSRHFKDLSIRWVDPWARA